jgi:hypothetical protein
MRVFHVAAATCALVCVTLALVHCVGDDPAQGDGKGGPDASGSDMEGGSSGDGATGDSSMNTGDGSSGDAGGDANMGPPTPDGGVVSVLTFATNNGSPQGSQRVIYDGQGNAIISFSLNTSTSIGDAGLTNSAGSFDVGLVKLSPTGGVIWAKTFGGSGSDQLVGMAVDDTGDIYISGSFEVGTGGTTTFGTQVLINPSQRYGTFIVKLRGSDGVPLAGFNYAQNLQGGSCSTLAFRNGQLAAGCTIEGDVSIAKSGGGAFNLTGTAGDGGTLGNNGYVILLDPADLRAKWVSQLKGVTQDFVSSVALAPNGDVVATGSFDSTTLADNSNSLLLTRVGTAQNAYVVRLAVASGFAVWAKSYGSTNTTDFMQATTCGVNNSGNTVFVAGSIRGTMGLGAGIAVSASGGMDDAFVAKLSGGDGTPISARSFGGAAVDSAASLALDPWDQPFVAGQYRSMGMAVDGKTLPDPVSTTSSAFLVKFDNALSALWARGFTTFTAPTLTQAWAVAVNPTSAGAGTAGVFQGTLNFGDGNPRQSYLSGGAYSAYFVEYHP